MSLTRIENFRNELLQLLKEKFPLIWIDCFDQEFLSEMFSYCFKHLGYSYAVEGEMKVSVWDSATCWRSSGKEHLKYVETIEDDEKNVIEVIKHFSQEPLFKILIIKEAWILEKDEAFFPVLQNFYLSNICRDFEERHTIIMVSTTSYSSMPSFVAAENLNSFEFNKLFRRLKMPYPDLEDIENELNSARYNLSQPIVKVKDTRRKLIAALSGMSIFDIRRVLTSIMFQSGGQIKLKTIEGESLRNRILEEKKKIVSDSGLMEVIPVANSYYERVGGIGALLQYLSRLKKIINKIEDYPSQMPRPKGILLVGPPGTGKSESAKSVASYLELPLLRLDVGSLMGMYVGQSEHNLMKAIEIAEAAQPCVLWIDEIEKAFAGASKEGGDITVTRMIGYFLTWMQEKKSLVYLVATANNLENLRPEFLRKGRWDEIFFLSLPNADEAKDIMSRCAAKYGLSIDGDITKLAKQVADSQFSGSEIDSLIVSTYNDIWAIKDETDNRCIPINQLEQVFNEMSKRKHESEESIIKEQIADTLQEMKLQYGGNLPGSESSIK